MNIKDDFSIGDTQKGQGTNIQETAYYVNLHLFHYFDYLSPKSRLPITSTDSVEPSVLLPENYDEQSSHYFMLNETTLLCMTDFNCNENSCQLYIRDVCGRHLWESVCLYETPSKHETSNMEMDFELMPRSDFM